MVPVARKSPKKAAKTSAKKSTPAGSAKARKPAPKSAASRPPKRAATAIRAPAGKPAAGKGAPRKATAAKAPVRAPSQRSKAAGAAAAPPLQWQPVADESTPGAPVWEPVADPAPPRSPPDTVKASAWPTPVARPPAPTRFDPATGAWLPAVAPAPTPVLSPLSPPASTDPAAQPAVDPAAYRRGPGSTVLNILLGIDIAFFVVGLLGNLYAGFTLVFMPESATAERLRDAVGNSTPMDIVQGTFLSLLMFGIVPFVWVLGTRIKPWQGGLRFLHLRFTGKDWLRGLALVPILLLAVVAISSLYVLLTEGPDGLTSSEDADNPAVQAILDNLSWPLAIFIALAAGIGEEIFFRGVLQRWLGIWGQGVVFGFAHAAGGYIPQILFATALGVVFGYLLKRGWSLWSLILAHVLYDFCLLALALVYPEFA